MIESALAETGASRSRTIMIGDTAFDLEMARNAGVSALGVTWGNHPVSDLECASAHHIVSKFEDLPKVISELIGQGALL
jgi:phosphoglycolate phosphatase